MQDVGLNLQSVNVKTHLKSLLQRRWFFPLIAVLLCFIIAFDIRAQASTLPQVDEWARNSVQNFYKNSIESAVAQQYPYLPQQGKQALVAKEFASFVETNHDKIEQETTVLAENIRAQFKDNDGTLYLPDIDTYVFYRFARNIERYGHIGDERRDGTNYDLLSVAPIGKRMNVLPLHPFIIYHFYIIDSFFRNTTLMGSMYWIPVIFSAFATIPAFFLGRRMGGNAMGFFTAFVIATSAIYLQRTMGGFADTDTYNVLMPLLIIFLFVESLAAKKPLLNAGFGAFTGLVVGVYAGIWVGWWYIFDMLIGISVLYGAYTFVRHKSFSSSLSRKTIVIVLASFIVASAVSVSLFTSATNFVRSPIAPFDFINLKDVATTTIWPNVYTTVAELNPITRMEALLSIGGSPSPFLNKILLFCSILGMIGIGIRFHDHNKLSYDPLFPLLILGWFVSTLYSVTSGVRFMMLMVPAFALGIGGFVATTFTLSSTISHAFRAPKMAINGMVVVVMLLLLLSPVKYSYVLGASQVPTMNDGWYDALSVLREKSSPDAIITSWWDFGHWFKAVAERRVTFDGGSQNRPQAHWVGKLFLQHDERESVGILRMLDCGAHLAYAHVFNVTNDAFKSVELTTMITQKNREEARSILAAREFSQDQIEQILGTSHCAPPEAYVVTSDDMVGKAQVWGHFGSWDFKRAEMYYKTHDQDRNEAIRILKEEFQREDAEQLYTEIATADPNQWIAPWPAYLSGLETCAQTNETIVCRINAGGNTIQVDVDLTTMNATVPTSRGAFSPRTLTFVDHGKIITTQTDSPLEFGVMLIPPGIDGTTYRAMIHSSEHAGSLFMKLYFYDGAGLDCFEKIDDRRQVTGGRIMTWKVKWECLSDL